ncbi:MAG: AsmA family protein [Alphaproteobacteria bacterium]|nr:AsmA family protein [Alphaproteobacteria bacterium]
MKRTWVIIVVAILALVAGLAGLGYFLIGRFDVKGLIEKAAYEQTGRVLTIKGAVQPAFYPSIGVHARDVTLANVAGGEAPSLLEAEEIQIGVAVAPLFNQDFNVTALVFVKPRLSLELDAEGRPNWVLTPIKAPKPARPGASPNGGIKDVHLAGARIEGGIVSYSNRKTGTRTGVQDIFAVVSLPSLDAPLGADGTAAFNGQKLDVAAKLGAPRAVLEGKTSPLAFSIKSEPVKAAFDGAFDVKTGGLAGLFEAGGPSLRKLAAWIGTPIGEASNLQTFHVAGRFTLGPKSAAFENAALELDAIKARGDFLVETARAKPAISGRLEIQELDLNPYLAPAPSDGAAPGAAPTARIESVDVAAPSGWSQTPIDFAGLKAVDANLDLTTGPLTALKLKLDRAKLDVVVHDGYLAATLSDLTLYGGSGKGRIELDARAPDVVLRQELDVAGVDAARFLADAAGFTKLEGRSNVKLTLESRGRDQQTLVSSSDGAIFLSLSEGALRGINLGGISRTIRTAMAGDVLGPNARTPFKTFAANFTISDGVGATDDLKIRAASAEITAAGVIDLGQRSLDIRIRPKSDSILSQVGIAPGAGIAVPFRITGPWAKPTYKMDLLGGARDTIAQQVNIVRTRAQMSRNAPK